MELMSAKLKRVTEAGYNAACADTVKCAAHCPVFNRAVEGCEHEAYMALGHAWQNGFQKKVDEEVAELLASWENE